MIKRIGAKKYVVLSRDGKKTLTKPMSHASAVKRLAQEPYTQRDTPKI